MPKPSFLARFTDIQIIFGKFYSFLHQKPPIILKHRTLAHKTPFLALMKTMHEVAFQQAFWTNLTTNSALKNEKYKKTDTQKLSFALFAKLQPDKGEDKTGGSTTAKENAQIVTSAERP